jgi:hypothetical protein
MTDNTHRRFLYMAVVVMSMTFAATIPEATAAPVECGARSCGEWKQEGSNKKCRTCKTPLCERRPGPDGKMQETLVGNKVEKECEISQGQGRPPRIERTPMTGTLAPPSEAPGQVPSPKAPGVSKQPGQAKPPTAKEAPPRDPAPQSREGVVIQGNQLRAQPGYILQAGPNNQVTARKAGGGPGGLGASASCGCDAGQGTCTLTVTGGTATCWKDSGNTCNGYCNFTTTQPSLSPGTMMRK